MNDTTAERAVSAMRRMFDGAETPAEEFGGLTPGRLYDLMYGYATRDAEDDYHLVAGNGGSFAVNEAMQCEFDGEYVADRLYAALKESSTYAAFQVRAGEIIGRMVKAMADEFYADAKREADDRKGREE